MKKLLTLSIFFIASLTGFAQLTNKVMVSPDYRGNGSNAIVVKWVAEKVIFTGGFNVYRQTAPNGEWQKLNTAAIAPTKLLPSAFESLPQEFKESYTMATGAPEADLHKAGLIRAFITLDILRSRELGEALGLVWYDETAAPGQSYRYKVEANSAKGAINLGESNAISAGPFVPLAAPKGIEVKRSRERVSIVWAIDEAVSVATLVEKSIGNGPFVPMSEVPYYIPKNINDKGESEYSDVFITDTEIERGQNYRYRLAAIDFFGQKGEYSPVFFAGMKGATLPIPPIDPIADVNDATRQVSLTWAHTDVSEIRGYVVMYRMDMADEPQLFVPDTLPATATSHQFIAQGEGSFLVTIGAVDAWGNVAESVPVLAKVDDVTPPAVPVGLTTTFQEGIVTINWQAPADNDLLGYQLYRTSGNGDAPDLASFIPMGNELLTNTSFKDVIGTSLAGKVYYAVAAIDKNFNKSERSAPVGITMPDANAPSVPFIKNITATEKWLTVNFMPNVDSDLAFFILKKTDAAGSTIEVQVSADAVQYDDKAIKPGETYTYSMAAQDLSGNLSAYSASLEAIAPGTNETILDQIKPSAISAKLAKSTGKVQLTWIQKFPTENLGVVIFRGIAKDNLLPISGLQRASGYLDETATPGNTYYYQVRTYAANGLQHQSEINEINIKAK